MKQSTKGAIDRYVNDGVEAGGFVLAVLSNNLKEAFARADDENTRDMREIVGYCYNEIPSVCWGSPEKVKAWFTAKGALRHE